MRTLILTLVVMAVPAAASAQVCPYGLVAVDAAHCCWPGQTFAPERGTCAGAPQCPAGLVPYGETCIASNTAQPQPQPAGTTLPPPPPPPANYQQVPPQQVQMQPMPQVFGYPVRFEAKKEGQEFSVSVDNGISCRTPCELTVPPGRHKVRVEGDAHFDDRVNFPASPSTVVVEKRGGIHALGVAGLAVGIPCAAVGGVVSLLGYAIQYGTGSSSARSTGQSMMYGGAGVAVFGVVFAAVGGGVGFGLAGKNRLKFAREANSEADEPAPAFQLVSAGVVPTKDGGMAGATFAF
ncbi:MAG: PEGA domain-containing protein [Myxococcales bacterium]